MRTVDCLLWTSVVAFVFVGTGALAAAQDSASIEPPSAALEEFAARPDQGPIYMLNLIKYKPDGRTRYFRYGVGAGKHLSQRGGSMSYIGLVEPCTDVVPAQPAGHAWDSVAIVRYPSRGKFLDILNDADYQTFLPHLHAALDRTLLYAFSDPEELPERLDATTADYGPDSVVAVALLRLKPESKRAYERYIRASRRLVSQYGGGILFAADGEQLLAGAGEWDRLVLTHFPSLHQLQALIDSAEYEHIVELRGEATMDTLFLITRPSAAP
ncbi:MAG: DUF1330 domain-containing protein [Candidatus Hydrogenedentales bacterium]